jgi:hypothetical protein
MTIIIKGCLNLSAGTASFWKKKGKLEKDQRMEHGVKDEAGVLTLFFYPMPPAPCPVRLAKTVNLFKSGSK